jgi:hypothetical protein
MGRFRFKPNLSANGQYKALAINPFSAPYTMGSKPIWLALLCLALPLVGAKPPDVPILVFKYHPFVD